MPKKNTEKRLAKMEGESDRREASRESKELRHNYLVFSASRSVMDHYTQQLRPEKFEEDRKWLGVAREYASAKAGSDAWLYDDTVVGWPVEVYHDQLWISGVMVIHLFAREQLKM